MATQKYMQSVSELAGQGPDLQEKVTKALQDANAQLQQITNVASQANKLQQTISGFQPQFDTFRASLEARERSFQEGSDALALLMRDLNVVKKSMDELVERARSVLGEATVAGLSDRFLNEANTLEGNLKRSQGLFFTGIVLFLLSAGAVLNVFPWLSDFVHIPNREPPSSENGWPNAVYLVGNIVGKLIVLLPSLFLVAFSAKWYAAQFRLRREYAYKYTVAASVPGFKVEAPQFSDAIAAIAFQQLVQSPADSSDTSAEKTNDAVGNSFLQRLLEPSIQKAVEKVLSSMERSKK